MASQKTSAVSQNRAPPAGLREGASCQRITQAILGLCSYFLAQSSQKPWNFLDGRGVSFVAPRGKCSLKGLWVGPSGRAPPTPLQGRQEWTWGSRGLQFLGWGALWAGSLGKGQQFQTVPHPLPLTTAALWMFLSQMLYNQASTEA